MIHVSNEMFHCKLHQKLCHHNLSMVPKKLCDIHMAFNVGLGTSFCNLCNKPIVLFISAVITCEGSAKVNQTPRIIIMYF